MNEAISYAMGKAVAKIDRIKDRNGWASSVNLKACGVDGRTLVALYRRGLIEKHLVGPIMDMNCVRLTRSGRRYV